MAVKILLADKSITIQKVVEMLFSGKEYEVACAGDGESALNEAVRVVPDVVLVDVDLPRIDGYSFASRLRQEPAFAQTPVILMLSRDDVFDPVKASQAGIIDSIRKPFESQELIGKVKKAVTMAPPRLAEPAHEAEAVRKPQAVPSDIFDIIREAPTQADIGQLASQKEETVFEVEPEVEVVMPADRTRDNVLPVGEKAVEEMRENLGIPSQQTQAPAELTSFESLDMATAAAREYMPPAVEPRQAAPVVPQISEDIIRGLAEEAVNRIAREVLERVAWEVIPALAERLILEEIERLKAGV